MAGTLRLYAGPSEEFERVTSLRLEWSADGKQESDDSTDPESVQTAHGHQAAHESGGIHYQRCGGGVRVIRKRIGG